MLRHLLPRAEWGGWGGDGPADRAGYRDDVGGGCICIQWLGLVLEIGVGRVRGRR